jgi:hypothetical protein
MKRLKWISDALAELPLWFWIVVTVVLVVLLAV